MVELYLYFGVPLLIFVLLSVAYLTLAERKILGAIQLRKGPNFVGIFGLLQPIVDGIKLLFKELFVPRAANPFLFHIAPIISFGVSLLTWVLLPITSVYSFCLIDFNTLYILALSSFGVYGIVFAGWASNSNYALLGSIRSAAQMISYEVSLTLSLLIVMCVTESFNLAEIVVAQANCWFIVPFSPLFIIFFVSLLAETNRTPFDLPEAEAELVAGYNVEYSAMAFAMFFLAEYSNMIIASILAALYFLGGWNAIYFFGLKLPGSVIMAVKVSCLLFSFILIRGTLPRYRYDQLMHIGWQILLPITIALFSFYLCVWFVFIN